jgi:mannose/fructose/N-acetylgalactosamine-specific phosphotransferase system component IIC
LITPFFFQESVLLSLLAALLAVDERAGWQSLLAHPVFAALLVGAILGQFEAALQTGVVLELVWLSILPMRGTRGPDTVTGTVVGIGTACLILRHTADTRVQFVVAVGVLMGLIVGELAGTVSRVVNRFREARLGGFEIPDGDLSATARRLTLYHFLSVGYTAAMTAIVTFVALAVSVAVSERLTATSSQALVAGTRWWLLVLPAIGAAALVQNYWHRHLNRFLLLSAGVGLVILWIR